MMENPNVGPSMSYITLSSNRSEATLRPPFHLAALQVVLFPRKIPSTLAMAQAHQSSRGRQRSEPVPNTQRCQPGLQTQFSLGSREDKTGRGVSIAVCTHSGRERLGQVSWLQTLKMSDKEDNEARPFLPPEAETPLLNPTTITAARCHSLPSLLLPSSTPHPTMRPSGSLFLSPQAKERPILKSSHQPTISILPTRARKRRRDRMDDIIYLVKYTLLLVSLGIGGGFLVWLAMRLTSTGTDNTPLYFSSVDPEDRELCGSPGGRIRNRRIVGGNKSDYAEWPWMVS